MKEFKVNSNGQIILVNHHWNFDELIIDGKIQDKLDGMPVVGRSRMYGKLNSGNEVKVTLGGNLKTHCNIFVDNELIFSE